MNKGMMTVAAGITAMGLMLVATGGVMAHPDEHVLLQSLAPGSQGVEKEGIVSSENVNLTIKVQKGKKEGEGTAYVVATADPTGGLGCGSLDPGVQCSFEIGRPTGEIILDGIERLEWTGIGCSTSTEVGGWKWDREKRKHLCFPEGKELVWTIGERDKGTVFVVVGYRRVPLGHGNEGYETKVSSMKHIHVPKEEHWLGQEADAEEKRNE